MSTINEITEAFVNSLGQSFRKLHDRIDDLEKNPLKQLVTRMQASPGFKTQLAIDSTLVEVVEGIMWLRTGRLSKLETAVNDFMVEVRESYGPVKVAYWKTDEKGRVLPPGEGRASDEPVLSVNDPIPLQSRPFSAGDIVRCPTSVSTERDRQYVSEAIAARHMHLGRIGRVAKVHDSHGRSCTVKFSDGKEAVYDDDELVLANTNEPPEGLRTTSPEQPADPELKFVSAGPCHTICIMPKGSPSGIPFEVALAYLKAGRRIKRAGWYDGEAFGPGPKDISLETFQPDAKALMANDWMIVQP